MTSPRLDPARREVRRAHLLAELTREPARVTPGRVRPRLIFASTAVALVAVLSLLAGGGRPGDASLVADATAAISRPGIIYHAVVDEHVRTAPPPGRSGPRREFHLLHELWQDPETGRTRERLWTLGPDGRRSELQSETVSRPPPATSDRPLSKLDALTALRDAYQQGGCACEQPRRISYAGRPALVLRFERTPVGGSQPYSHVVQSVILSAKTLHPLQVDVRTRDRSFHNDHRLVFRSFEELPATPATQQLLEAGHR